LEYITKVKIEQTAAIAQKKSPVERSDPFLKMDNDIGKKLIIGGCSWIL